MAAREEKEHTRNQDAATSHRMKYFVRQTAWINLSVRCPSPAQARSRWIKEPRVTTALAIPGG